MLSKLEKKIYTSWCSFSFRNDFELSVDTNGGLGSEEDGVVSLAHDAIEDALKKTGAVSQRDEHQSLALTTEAMNPAVNLKNIVKSFFQV